MYSTYLGGDLGLTEKFYKTINFLYHCESGNFKYPLHAIVSKEDI